MTEPDKEERDYIKLCLSIGFFFTEPKTDAQIQQFVNDTRSQANVLVSNEHKFFIEELLQKGISHNRQRNGENPSGMIALQSGVEGDVIDFLL